MSFFDVIEPFEQPCPKCGGRMKKIKRPINCEAVQCESCHDEFGESYITGWVEANMQMNNPMPCGHKNRYLAKDEKDTEYCVVCRISKLERIEIKAREVAALDKRDYVTPFQRVLERQIKEKELRTILEDE